MISVGSRDGRKALDLVLEMEETELEEGEALCYQEEDGDSTIDPDISFSYIEKKLQNVLGHFQKDFEGGVSAENLGAKFGGYGSFLPTYQRSPSWSHTRSPPELHSYDSPRSPRKLHLEDQQRSSLASSSASPAVRSAVASGRAASVGHSYKGDGYLPSRHAEESSAKSGGFRKSINPPDQRTLKVRIKVGSENLSTKKNTEIYSGLGLLVSPSSSLDDSPTASEGLHGKLLDVPVESPTSILQIMTSFPSCQLLSPLPEDLIRLTDKRKLKGKYEAKPIEKTSIENSGIIENRSLSTRSKQKVLEQRKGRSSEKDDAFFLDSTNQTNNDNHNSASLLEKEKEKETDDDTLGCEELVSNALKLPLLSSSQDDVTDPVKETCTAKIGSLHASGDGVKGETFSAVIEKEHFDGESALDAGRVEMFGGRLSLSGKVSECKKGNTINCPQPDVSKAEKSYASDLSESNVPKGRKALSAEPTESSKHLLAQKGGCIAEESSKPTPDKSSSAGSKKQKVVNKIGAQGSYMAKDQLMVECSMTPKSWNTSHANFLSINDSHELCKDNTPGDRYKDFFGVVEFEDEDNESISGEMTSSGKLKGRQIIGKRSLSECRNSSKEKSNVKSSEKSHSAEKDPKAATHLLPNLVNGPIYEAPTGIGPVVNEDWVSCDRCKKWRLLPLGTNLKSLPHKWLCRMLTWLPGMNRCSVPENETTNALRALYHPAASILPAPASESQNSQLDNPIVTSSGIVPVDARHPGQEHVTIHGKRKQGSSKTGNSADLDGLTHFSNSQKNNLSTSWKSRNLDSINDSPSIDAFQYQNMQQSSSAVEKQSDAKKDEIPVASSSDKGTSSKIRRKRESDVRGSRASKRMKSEELHYDEEKWTSDNATFSKGGRASTSLSNNASVKERRMDNSHKDWMGEAKKGTVSGTDAEVFIPGNKDDGLIHSRKSDEKDSVRKRRSMEPHGSQIHIELGSSLVRPDVDFGEFTEEMCENDHRNEKRARVSMSGGKGTNGGKAIIGSDKNGRITLDQHSGQCLSNSLAVDYLRNDMGTVQPSVAANSSSSKVSGSHKNATGAQEVKGSPVESVSSSPLRFSHADKETSSRKNLVGKVDCHDSGSLTAVKQRRLSDGEIERGNDQALVEQKDSSINVNDHLTDAYNDHLGQNNQYSRVKHTSEQCQVEEKANIDYSQNHKSHTKRSMKGLSSHSNDKARTSGSELDIKVKASESSHDSLDHMHLYEEKSKSRRNKFDGKSGTLSKAEMKKDITEGTLNVSSKAQSQNVQDVTKSQDKKHNIHQEPDRDKLPKKSNQAEVHGSGKSHSLPPLARVQPENTASLKPVSGSRKENGEKSVHAFDEDVLKDPKDRKNAENQNGQPISTRHPTPNSHKVRDVEAPSPLRRDSSSHAANNALKEAKDLKHLADRLKNSGSTESNGFYFQAALKFLHGASLLESGGSEPTKHNELLHSMHIYSSTAKLCEFCAHEYEKSKDMAAAALAYKCVEVAYMRVIYTSHVSASRDRNELQASLQIVPPAESPSSSASDVDNLNHQGTTDKAALAKVVGSPQVSGSHVITSRNRSCLQRILNLAQDVNFAMEASRKSRIAFTAATSVLGETPNKEVISSLKKALDFNFQDVEGLLRLVRIAMEAVSR